MSAAEREALVRMVWAINDARRDLDLWPTTDDAALRCRVADLDRRLRAASDAAAELLKAGDLLGAAAAITLLIRPDPPGFERTPRSTRGGGASPST